MEMMMMERVVLRKKVVGGPVTKRCQSEGRVLFSQEKEYIYIGQWRWES